MNGFRVGQRLSGYNRPNHRRRGLAGLGDQMVYGLTPSQVSQFLGRNAAVRSRVQDFESEVQWWGYVQGTPGYSIPPYGIAVADSEFGNVTIFPDADGTLRYTGGVQEGVAIETNKPPYVSPPPANPAEAWIKVLEYAPYVLAAGAGLWLLTLLPRSRG